MGGKNKSPHIEAMKELFDAFIVDADQFIEKQKEESTTEQVAYMVCPFCDKEVPDSHLEIETCPECLHPGRVEWRYKDE